MLTTSATTMMSPSALSTWNVRPVYRQEPVLLELVQRAEDNGRTGNEHDEKKRLLAALHEDAEHDDPECQEAGTGSGQEKRLEQYRDRDPVKQPRENRACEAEIVQERVHRCDDEREAFGVHDIKGRPREPVHLFPHLPFAHGRGRAPIILGYVEVVRLGDPEHLAEDEDPDEDPQLLWGIDQGDGVVEEDD